MDTVPSGTPAAAEPVLLARRLGAPQGDVYREVKWSDQPDVLEITACCVVKAADSQEFLEVRGAVQFLDLHSLEHGQYVEVYEAADGSFAICEYPATHAILLRPRGLRFAAARWHDVLTVFVGQADFKVVGSPMQAPNLDYPEEILDWYFDGKPNWAAKRKMLQAYLLQTEPRQQLDRLERKVDLLLALVAHQTKDTALPPWLPALGGFQELPTLDELTPLAAGLLAEYQTARERYQEFAFKMKDLSCDFS